MSTIHWNVSEVKVNLPDIYAEEYPVSVPSNISASEVIKNTGKVKYCFCFAYNGGEILSDDYAVLSNGKVNITLPNGMTCLLSGNQITVSETEYLTLDTLPVYEGDVG